ncbi:MAG: hypothetical protein HWN66_21865, partial [Candidatus Helarchaeota archaeon]|nr:hypothetical protein [Candidatus Helarchaeota archaeon]
AGPPRPPPSAGPPRPTIIKCKWCKGTGVCYVCKGTGRYRDEVTPSLIAHPTDGPSLMVPSQIPPFENTGTCYLCKGTGRCFCREGYRVSRGPPAAGPPQPVSLGKQDPSISGLRDEMLKEIKRSESMIKGEKKKREKIGNKDEK